MTPHPYCPPLPTPLPSSGPPQTQTTLCTAVHRHCAPMSLPASPLAALPMHTLVLHLVGLCLRGAILCLALPQKLPSQLLWQAQVSACFTALLPPALPQIMHSCPTHLTMCPMQAATWPVSLGKLPQQLECLNSCRSSFHSKIAHTRSWSMTTNMAVVCLLLHLPAGQTVLVQATPAAREPEVRYMASSHL